MLSEWDKNSAGNIWLTPLVRFQVSHLHDIGVGLRLELSSSQAEQNNTPKVAQISMSVEQAQELIAVLQLQVDAILTAGPSGPMN